MPNSTIASLTAITTPAAGDILEIVSVADLTDSASGSSRRITRANLVSGLAASGANSDILSLSGLTTALSVAQGGTASTTASGARTALGLVIGTNVQAWDAQLDELALKVIPAGTLADISTAQILTNKTAIATTNDIAAKSLHSATTVVDVSAATAPSSGQVLTATSSTAATWQAPASTAPLRCRVYKSANQSINNTTDTLLTWNAETFDNNTMHDNSTENSRITATTAGVYLFKAQVAFASNATGLRQCHFRKNGTDALAYVQLPAANGDRTTIQVATIVELSATDYVDVVAGQNSGGALNIEGAASDAYYASHYEAIRIGSLT